MDLKLSGQTVLITGASQGIGAVLAKTFAGEGCNLVLVARSQDKLEALQSELKASHPDLAVEIAAEDLASEGSATRLADRFGDKVDVLVNNAGSVPGGNLWAVDEARWRQGWELKVMGYINLTRAFYQHMRDRGHGVIVNNIGAGGELYDFEYIAGTTGNAALMAFTRALGGRSLEHGIRVVGVNAGPVATDRIVKIMRERAEKEFGDPEQCARLFERLPRGRAASPQEISDMIVFLASPRSDYTTGVIMTIDGGMTSNKSIT